MTFDEIVNQLRLSLLAPKCASDPDCLRLIAVTGLNRNTEIRYSRAARVVNLDVAADIASECKKVHCAASCGFLINSICSGVNLPDC
ncbi:hypothetical protein D9M71_752910 [compost metagenome]